MGKQNLKTFKRNIDSLFKNPIFSKTNVEFCVEIQNVQKHYGSYMGHSNFFKFVQTKIWNSV